MFTGIVRGMGQVVGHQPNGGDLELAIAPQGLELSNARVGDSIAVNGVCLTITRLAADRFSADVSRETLAHTTLGSLAPGSNVNLELPLRAGEALGGHLVSGHVDGVGKLLGRAADARSERFEFEVPRELARYIAAKGSVCIDGISLTVNEVSGARFGVNLIPHTLSVTTLGQLTPGGSVNIEVDLIARYLERLSQGS
jgi:riboflavin synthase